MKRTPQKPNESQDFGSYGKPIPAMTALDFVVAVFYLLALAAVLAGILIA